MNNFFDEDGNLDGSIVAVLEFSGRHKCCPMLPDDNNINMIIHADWFCEPDQNFKQNALCVEA